MCVCVCVCVCARVCAHVWNYIMSLDYMVLHSIGIESDRVITL